MADPGKSSPEKLAEQRSRSLQRLISRAETLQRDIAAHLARLHGDPAPPPPAPRKRRRRVQK